MGELGHGQQRDINVVFLDIDLWDNVGDLRGDSGVGFK